MVLKTGEKAIQWLNKVNENRDLQNRLNLADKSTKNPVPPENPKVSSTELILQKFHERIDALPDSMKDVLLNNKELTEVPSVDDESFIKNIRLLNGSYQNAIRWLGQIPYLNYYSQNNLYDIRGYYFLKKEIDLSQKLDHFSELDLDMQNKLSGWLVGMCHNSKISFEKCKKELAETKALGFYKKYLPQAEKTYQNFFTVEAIREDLTWNSDKTKLTQKFIDPSVEKISHWLKTNVEDEWKDSGFQLAIEFVSQNLISPYLEFVTGATPHVSGDTFNKITMDPNYSLDDYDTQWTIRHEFGHVLGFPDCYLEFYDTEAKAMTYYTIEPDNLMCAWGGHLQASHVKELKEKYR